MEESPETENSLSFTFDYLKDIRYDEAANMLEIILRTDERICLHATEEPSKKQLKEIFGQSTHKQPSVYILLTSLVLIVQSHRIQTKVDTEDDGGRTVVARKMATRDKLLVLPPPNRIRELPPKGANPRKPTTEWRNPLFSSPKAIQHMKGGSLAAASTNSGAEARDWTSEEGESVNCNRKSDEAPLRPKKRDSSSPSGRLPNEEGGFFSS